MSALSWQTQRIVILEVQVLWHAQPFVDLELQISKRRIVAGAALCADFAAWA